MAYNVLPLAMIIGLSFLVLSQEEQNNRLSYILGLLLTIAAGADKLLPAKGNASSFTLIDSFVNRGYIIFFLFMIGDIALDFDQTVNCIVVGSICGVLYLSSLIQLAVVWWKRKFRSDAIWEMQSAREFEQLQQETDPNKNISEDRGHCWDFTDGDVKKGEHDESKKRE